MARFCDARALCRTAKGIDRIGKIGKGHFYRHQRRNGGKVLFVRVLIGFIEVMLHHLFQGDKVIHGRFGKKISFFTRLGIVSHSGLSSCQKVPPYRNQ